MKNTVAIKAASSRICWLFKNQKIHKKVGWAEYFFRQTGELVNFKDRDRLSFKAADPTKDTRWSWGPKTLNSSIGEA